MFTLNTTKCILRNANNLRVLKVSEFRLFNNVILKLTDNK